MYRVINTVVYSNSWIRNLPELVKRGEGLLLVLDPGQISELNVDVDDQDVRIQKPDGSVFSCRVVCAYVGPAVSGQNVVGLFFRDLLPEQVPSGSGVMFPANLKTKRRITSIADIARLLIEYFR